MVNLVKEDGQTDNVTINHSFLMVPFKRRSSINSGAWLQRFDDVTGVETSCIAKAKKEKK